MKNREELKKKNDDNILEILDATKNFKRQTQPQNLKKFITSSTFGENTTRSYQQQ